LVLHTYVLRVQYSCGVVLVFWFWREIVFGVMYVLSVQYCCAVVSVFWLWPEIDLKIRTCFYKKNLIGLLWGLVYGTNLSSLNSFCEVIFSPINMRKICYTQCINYTKHMLQGDMIVEW
jgi:hypothetical protein